MEATENTPLPSNEGPKSNPFPGTFAGGLISASVLIIPIGAVIFFVAYCNSTGGKFDLESSVEVTSALKVSHVACALPYAVKRRCNPAHSFHR